MGVDMHGPGTTRSSVRYSADIALPDTIRTDMLEFVAAMQADETLEPKAFGVRMSAAEAVERLAAAYGL